MSVHKNAKLTPRGRGKIARRGAELRHTPKAVAAACGAVNAPCASGSGALRGHRITGDRTGQSNCRNVGWEYFHVCIDGHSRITSSQILPDGKKQSATAFLDAAVACYQSLGVAATRFMTDNGSHVILLPLADIGNRDYPSRNRSRCHST